MSITAKTRKILWAKSGNVCAICKKPLVLDKTSYDSEAIIGDECHIAAQNSGGPRFNKEFNIDGIDDLYNLILLCKTDHKMVDDQSETYTIDLLRLIKQEHEDWVIERLSKNKADKAQKQPTYLIHIRNGKDLFNIVYNAHAYRFDFDETDDIAKMEVIKCCLQEIQDYGEISSDLIEITERIDAMEGMKNIIEEIEGIGYLVFGLKENKTFIDVNDKRVKWNIATVKLVNADNPTIITYKYE